MKVVELVMAREANGWSPEELFFQFPHVSMAQIHSALAYYWDHRAEIDHEIAERCERAESLRAKTSSALGDRLRQLRVVRSRSGVHRDGC